MASALLTSIAVLTAVAASIESATAATLNPNVFTSLGTLSPSAGSFMINTEAMTIIDAANPGAPLFTGVSVSQSGGPEIAVFTFDEISLPAGVNVNVSGSRALAMLSQGGITLSAVLSVSGGNGQSNAGGVGRAGGYAGGDASGERAPGPGGGWRGQGGPITFSTWGTSGGGGGGHGGRGSDGQPINVAPGGNGGLAYGDLELVIQGGSGGGRSGPLNSTGVTYRGGGAGGGAVELGAVRSILLAGELLANGGSGGGPSGGGGAGGGLRIHGESLRLMGALRADGGSGGSSTSGDGGGGGGGRILIDAELYLRLGAQLSTTAAEFKHVQSPSEHGVMSAGRVTLVLPAGQTQFLNDLPAYIPASMAAPSLFGVEVEPGSTFVITQGGMIAKLNSFGQTSLVSGALHVQDSDGVKVTAGAVDVGTIASLTAVHGLDVAAGAKLNVLNAFSAGNVSVNRGEINAINAVLAFPGDGMKNAAGLTNYGRLNLTSTVVNGDVHSPAGSSINIASSAVFNGLVSGAGNFRGSSLATFNGGYSPGDSAAVVEFAGDVALGDANTLAIELGGTTVGAEYDSLEIEGSATLEGRLGVSLIDAFLPAAGDMFDLLHAQEGVFGQFDSVSLPPLPAGLGWNVIYSNLNVMLKVVPALAADFDEDGDVDGNDLAGWKSGFGAPSPAHMQGDADGDQDADGTDFLIWQRQLGSPMTAGANAAVPEPATLGLLVSAALAAFFRHRAAVS